MFIDKLNNKARFDQLIDNIMEMIEREKKKKEADMKKVLMKNAFSNDASEQINVFVSFHFSGARRQAEFILSILEEEQGIDAVREFDKKNDVREIEQWIDQKIKSTSVTILLLSEEISESRWVGREIEKSIEGNNKFVLIDISKGRYDKKFLHKYKIESKSLDEIYPIYSVNEINKREEFADVGKWVRDAVANI